MKDFRGVFAKRGAGKTARRKGGGGRRGFYLWDGQVGGIRNWVDRVQLKNFIVVTFTLGMVDGGGRLKA